MGDAFVVALLQGPGRGPRRHPPRPARSPPTNARRWKPAATAAKSPAARATHGFEIDHVTGWTATHTTQLDDLVWLCAHHHDQKTHRGARLTGPPGTRTWHPPPPKAGANGNRSPSPPAYADTG